MSLCCPSGPARFPFLDKIIEAQRGWWHDSGMDFCPCGKADPPQGPGPGDTFSPLVQPEEQAALNPCGSLL